MKKSNLLFISIIIVLVFIVYFSNKGCNNNNIIKSEIKIDTIYNNSRIDTLISPSLINNKDSIPKDIKEKYKSIKKVDSISLEEYNKTISLYNLLLIDYNKILDSFYSLKTYKDTIKKDSSTLISSNRVYGNSLIKSEYEWNVKYPIITKETKITEIINTRQLYIGGGLLSNLQTNIIHLGFIYKNKKDNLFGCSYGLDNFGKSYGQADFYTKIKLR